MPTRVILSILLVAACRGSAPPATAPPPATTTVPPAATPPAAAPPAATPPAATPPAATPPAATPPAATPPTAAAGTTVAVPMFGDVAIADGELAMIDGGIHGVQGHTIRIAATGDASWERRLDGMQPHGKPGAGKLALTADEATRARGWADQLWKLAPRGKASFDQPIEHGVPRWVWCIVLRRGEEIRVLSGGGMSSPDNAPEPAKSALRWLVERVDAVAAAP